MYESMLRDNSNHSSLSIGWFVSLSLLLHMLLFWGITEHQGITPTPAPQQAANGLHINLAPYRVQLQRSKTEHQPQQTAAKARNKVSQAKAITTTNHAKSKQETDASFRERIMVKLRHALNAQFSYPLLARQRNWQGEVILAFRVERDGRISNARIARSSGYRLLDHDALGALNRVEMLGEILPHSLTVELPVIYRLEG